MGMKNNKLLFVSLVSVIILGLAGYLFYSHNKSTPSINNPDTSLVYTNTDYGFNFTLPTNWLGYSIVTDEWNGNPLKGNVEQSGPKILIRNPKWTAAAPYEDLPILIFTTQQWDAYLSEDFAVGAAPIMASELGRNNKYVFALPARWDFDYSLGYEEAQGIFAGKPFQAFDIGTSKAKSE